MMDICDNGRYVVPNIYPIPQFDSFNVGIIRPNVVWGTIFGNGYLQSVTYLALSGHIIYISLFGSLTNKTLGKCDTPIPLTEEKRVPLVY